MQLIYQSTTTSRDVITAIGSSVFEFLGIIVIVVAISLIIKNVID